MYGPNKRGFNTKIYLAVDAHGMPLRVIITQGTTADCTKAEELIQGMHAEYLLADKAYDVNVLLKYAEASNMRTVIPPKTNRTQQRKYDRELYKIRHLVECAFLKLKQWRGIATRYAKNVRSFLAAVQIRCIILWAQII